MAKNLYDIEQVDSQTKRFTVRPLSALGIGRKLMLLVALGIIYGALSSYGKGMALFWTGLAFLVVFWFTTMGGSWNRGRRLTQFTVGPDGITFIKGGRGSTNLPLADIERMYVTAPNVAELVVHSGVSSGGGYGGVSSTGGLSAALAKRSWQVVVQARGAEHWLGGGLNESMASSLSMQVQRALRGQ